MNAQLKTVFNERVGGFSERFLRQHADYLAESADASRAHASFRDFFESYLSKVAAAYSMAQSTLFQASWNHWRDLAPSPFGSVLLGECLDSAEPLEAGGARFSLFGVNILGLGTTVDSLHAINELVFKRKELSIRMRGLSAKFVALSGNVQDALIERSEKGV